MPLAPDIVARYLGVLGVGRRPPGLSALAEIVEAHVTRVPFENVSKLHRLRHLGLRSVPDVSLFLDGVERHHLGGTCYANNIHLHALLETLGYDVALCGADMDAPDVHAVVFARVDGRELLVDAGYGAPFLDPLPRDAREAHVVALGRERWVLAPRDPAGRSRLDHHRDGRAIHGYVAKPARRTPADFGPAVAASFRPEATFMNRIAIARFERGRSTILHDLELVESAGAHATVRLLGGRGDVAAAAEDRFGIPRSIVEEAIASVPDLSARTWH